MKLKELNIRIGASYEDHAGKYLAEVEYVDKSGNIKVIIPPEATHALLTCIGETITKFSAQAALELQKNIALSIEESKAAPQIELEPQEA